MIRLFTALPLDAACIAAMSLLRQPQQGVRWIERDNLHLTLQFIGEVDSGQYPRIVDALGSVVSPPFSFNIKGGGYFGNSRNPRVIWAGIEACPDLLDLNRSVRAALAPLVELERRKYTPHISLARLKSCTPQVLAGLLESVHYLDLPDQAAREFRLYSSRLGPQGSQYSLEASFPFTE